MPNFNIFYNDTNNPLIEGNVDTKWFRFENFGVSFDYHNINKKMRIGLEFFLTRAIAEDLEEPATLHRFIEVDPPDWDLEEAVDRGFLNDAVLAYSEAEFDLTTSIGVNKNYKPLIDFGAANTQKKIHNKAVGQVFTIASGAPGFDVRFSFNMATNSGSPTGLLTVKLWDTDGSNLPLNELGSYDITPNPGGLNTVEFQSVNLADQNKYAFTIQDDGTNDVSNAFRVSQSNEGIYTGGDWIDDLGGWSADAGNTVFGYYERR